MQAKIWYTDYLIDPSVQGVNRRCWKKIPEMSRVVTDAVFNKK